MGTSFGDRLKSLGEDYGFRLLLTSGAVILSALVQCFALQALVRPAGIISGGFTGIAMLMEALGSRWGIPVSMQAVMLILNVPIALFCGRGISLRFTVFSLAQVALSSFFLQVCQFGPLFADQILNVIFGGVLMGASVVIALKGNASTGGTDFISLYVTNRMGKSIWTWVFMGNAVLYCVYGALFGWMAAGYSIIVQYISTRIISAFHHRYELVTMQITTKLGPEMVDAYVSHFRHGISCVEAEGGYSKQKMYLLNTVISSYETSDVIRLLRQVDSRVIINVMKTERFVGSFYRKPME